MIRMKKRDDSRSDLERHVLSSWRTPELRREEKLRYLGFFRERVLQALTFAQLSNQQYCDIVIKTMREDKRADELVIRNEAWKQAMPLIQAAREEGVDFTVSTNPRTVGPVAVVLVAAEAVDEPQLLAEEAPE